MAKFDTVLKSNKREIVAAALEKAILSGELKIGEKLPSEQNLAFQFGVSRNILREALNKIEERGLLEVRNGTGCYIAMPTSTDMSDMLTRLVVLSEPAINDYYEIRLALEVKACELAAKRAIDDDISELEIVLEKMKTKTTKKSEFGRLDCEFHFVIAKATRNSLFSSLLQPLKIL